MKTSVAAFFLFACLVFAAPDAHAFVQDWGEAGGGVGGGPTVTSYSGPIPISCYAMGSQQQRCRECLDHYDYSGQPTGRKVCAYVAYKAACKCTLSPSTCSPIGTCTYFDS